MDILEISAEQYHRLSEQFRATHPQAIKLTVKRTRARKNRARRRLSARRKTYWANIQWACEREMTRLFRRALSTMKP